VKRVVLITSDHPRHRWLAYRVAIAGRLIGLVAERKRSRGTFPVDSALASHYLARSDAEGRWFGGAPTYAQLCERTVEVEWGKSSGEDAAAFVASCEPELVLLFGSSIIKGELLIRYPGKIINLHLGLSPYYRGSATNFWPLVDGLPECVGATVHHATSRVDGGRIIGQCRPNIESEDDIHDIGCRAIIAGATKLAEMVVADRSTPEGVEQTTSGTLCRSSDFGAEALFTLERRLKDGMIPKYIDQKPARDARYPIVPFEGAQKEERT